MTPREFMIALNDAGELSTLNPAQFSPIGNAGTLEEAIQIAIDLNISHTAMQRVLDSEGQLNVWNSVTGEQLSQDDVAGAAALNTSFLVQGPDNNQHNLGQGTLTRESDENWLLTIEAPNPLNFGSVFQQPETMTVSYRNADGTPTTVNAQIVGAQFHDQDVAPLPTGGLREAVQNKVDEEGGEVEKTTAELLDELALQNDQYVGVNGFIGVPDGYSPSIQGFIDLWNGELVDPNDLDQIQIGLVGEAGDPQYEEGVQYEIESSWSVVFRQQQQFRMQKLGLLAPGSYFSGLLGDDSTIKAFTSVLGYANRNGLSWENAMKRLESSPPTVGPLPEFKPERRTKSDPAALRERVVAEFQNQLGREPSAGEMAEFVQFLDQEYGIANQMAEDRQRREAIEAGINAGGDPSDDQLAFLDSQGEDFQDVDVESRFREQFRERMRQPIQQRDDRDQAQRIGSQIAGTVQAGGN